MSICVYRYSKEEPFSVISVDIRNHSTLLDSLEQYVKGELLEGADAYHCERCNKKVCVIDDNSVLGLLNHTVVGDVADFWRYTLPPS
jgi:ubiquitin C-terminal hydrolase